MRSDLAGRGIVFVNNFPERHLGGGEIYLLHLAKGAEAAGMRVGVVAMPDSGLADEAAGVGATVMPVDLMGLGPTRAAGPVAARLTDFEADIVHGTGYYTNMVARLAGRRVGCRVVNSVLCEPASTLAFARGARARLVQRIRQAADNATAGQVDVIIANSFAVRDGLVSQGLPAGRIEVVHNGIDTGAVRAEAARGALPDALAELARARDEEGGGTRARPAGDASGLPGTPWAGSPVVIVGTAGRLEAVKGLDVLLDAVGPLAARVPGVKVAIAGEGALREHLEARIRDDAALADTVLLAGYVPSAPALMCRLDVYCLPSLSEGMNTTILEALALGVPVAATAVGGAPEVIDDRVTGGRLVPAGDAAALAAAIADLAEDREGARRMAAAGRARVEDEFTVARMVTRTFLLYERVLEGS